MRTSVKCHKSGNQQKQIIKVNRRLSQLLLNGNHQFYILTNSIIFEMLHQIFARLLSTLTLVLWVIVRKHDDGERG